MKKIISIFLLTVSLVSCNEASLIEGIEPTEKAAKEEDISNKVQMNSQSHNIVWAERKLWTSRDICLGNLPDIIMINFGKNAQGLEQFIRIDNLKSLTFKETAGKMTNTSCTMEVAYYAVDANYNTILAYLSVGEGTVELKADKTFRISNVKLRNVDSPFDYITVSASGKYTE